MTVRTIDDIFRDFVIDGVPASGPFNPHKPDIRDTLKALTEGGDNFPDNRVIRLNNADEGMANNIVVTASVTIPAAAYQVLYILNVTQENTGPVTVSGAINRSLVTNASQPVPNGYLTPGMAVLCVDNGTSLRMLSYGDMETIVREAEAAQSAAEAARDIAAGYASDAVSQGNVPIYSTVEGMHAIEVPEGINAIRVNGRQSAGDGLGGLYVDEDNGSTETLASADGRTWYKVVDVQAERVVQAPAYTRMTSRIVSDVLAGQPISPFHFGGNGLAIDQSNALQNALEFALLDDTNPQVCTLDLVGRNWRTTKGLAIRDVPKTKRTIQNGQLTAIGTYADEALLDIRPTANGGAGGSNANWVHALKIKDVNILGGPSAGAVLVDDSIAVKNAHGVVIEGCYLQWFRGHGIIDYTDRAATETIVRYNRIVGAFGNSEGIRTSGADAEIGGKNIISNCRRGIVSLMHSVNVEYNHIYDCTEASIYYNDTAALCQGNYIDNAPIIIRNPRGLFTGNKFLRALTSPMGDGSAFIVLFPRVPTLFVQGFNFQGNSFANTAGNQVKMFAVDETEGSIGAVYSSIVDGNTISSAVGTVLHQRSRPRGRIQISAGVSGALDLQSQLPFGNLKHAEVTWNKDSASSVIPAVAVTNISNANVVTVGLSQAATGLAYIRGDINEFV